MNKWVIIKHRKILTNSKVFRIDQILCKINKNKPLNHNSGSNLAVVTRIQFLVSKVHMK